MSLAGYLPPVVAEVVSEIGKYSAGMGEVKAEMSSLEAANTKMAAAGKVAAAGLAIAIAGVGYESVKLAMGFDQAMEVIHTQAGASQAEVDGLKNSVLALSGSVGIGPEELATGLYHIESTGMRGAAAMDVLTQSAKLAKIGMADLDSVTYAMSGVMSIGMKDVANAADAISYLNATVGMGDMRMDQLTAAIGTGILPSFKSAGLGMKDFSAALATISDNSTPADEAATRLRMTISMMSAPSGPAIEALKKIGLSSTALATDLRQPNGLLVAVDDLKKHLEDSGKSAVEQNAIIEQAFGGGKTSGSILTLLEETDRLKSKYDQLGTAASRAAATDDAWAQQQKQFSQQWSEFSATLQATGVKIGNYLIPKLQDMFTWINKNGETVKSLAIAISGVLIAALAAWALNMAVVAAENIAATWEILLIIAAIAALAYGIYELVKHWSTVWNWIKHIASDVWGWLVGAWHATINALADAAHWVKTKVIDPVASWFNTYFLGPIRFVFRLFQDMWLFAFGFASVIIGNFLRDWTVVWTVVTTVANWAWTSVLKPVLEFIVRYGINPVIEAWHALQHAWEIGWEAIKKAAQWAWDNVIKPVMGFIKDKAIDPVKSAIGDLRAAWEIGWDAIKHAVQVAWDIVKPIFDKITGAVSSVKGAVGGILGGGPVQAGKNIAHLFGFADGGVVPGPTGAPQLAVVHGGEQILSNDQLASMGRGRVLAGSTGGGGGGFGGGGDIVINQRIVMPDGKLLREQQLRYARRAGISPADLYPDSTTALTRL